MTPLSQARLIALLAPAATQESLLARDRIDSGRATAPLVQADGAVHIDTTPYTLEEVIGLVVGLVRELDGVAEARPRVR